MRAAVIALLALALAGCSTLPSPAEPAAAGNTQIRLSAVRGAVEGGVPLAGGGIEGAGCVYTQLGAVAPGVDLVLEQGSCRARVTGAAR